MSREIWDAAEQIRNKRAQSRVIETTGNRERYTRQYAFSSMCECVYCGHKLTRRTRHSSSIYEKPVWQCMNATKNGIANCPNCKAIDEAILEGAFVDAFTLLAGNFDEVLDVVLSYVEDSANNDDNSLMKRCWSLRENFMYCQIRDSYYLRASAPKMRLASECQNFVRHWKMKIPPLCGYQGIPVF